MPHRNNIARCTSAQERPFTDEWLGVAAQAADAGLIPAAATDKVRAGLALGLLPAADLPGRVRELLAAGPAAGRALDSIASGFKPGEAVELRALDPGTGRAHSLSGRLDVPDERAALESFIKRHNGRANIYVGVNPRRPELAGTDRPGTAADVIARRVVVLDFDNKDVPPTDPDWTGTVRALQALRPLLTLASGNGAHVWLPVDEIAGAEALAASVAPLAALMARLGADNMSDLPRIARLPFTINLPNARKRQRGAVVRLALPMEF